MGVTALPSSLLPPLGAAAAAAAASRAACASRRRFDPARIGSSTNAAVATKKGSKRPGPLRIDEPPTKRRRGRAEDASAAAPGKALISPAEKDCVKRLLLSLPPLVRSPNEVIRFPDSFDSFLQMKGTRRGRCSGGADAEEIQIEVNALRAIKNPGGACLGLGGRLLREEEAPSPSKGGVIGHGQSKPRTGSIRSKVAASKINPPRAEPKTMLLRTTPTNIPSKAASKTIPARAAPPKPPELGRQFVTKLVETARGERQREPESCVQEHPQEAATLRAVSKSLPTKAASKSNLPRAAPTRIPPRAAALKPKTSMPRAAQMTALSKSAIKTPSDTASKSIPAGAMPSFLAPPKLSQSRVSVTKLVKTAIAQSPPRSTSPAVAPLLQAPPKSMKQLLAEANKAMQEVVRRREINKLRATARWEVEQMVRTVEFNDPYIDYTDVFK